MKIRVKIDLFRSKIGFTLVEVLVVLSLIGLVATIAVVNLPIIQKRARDAQRLTDLRQLQLVLEKEIILSDVYPLSTGSFEIKDHSWGSLWAEHNYRLPKDPLSSQKYIYVSDGQTYQLYANFEDLTSFSNFACPSSCGPDGLYNAGITGGSGTSKAGLISWSSLGTASVGVGLPTTEKKVSMIPLPPGRQDFVVHGGDPPNLSSGYLDPLDPAIGLEQKVNIRMKDSSSITSVTALVTRDNGIRTFPLNLVSGTDLDGDWEAIWVVADTHISTYLLSIRATDNAGRSSQYDITLR